MEETHYGSLLIVLALATLAPLLTAQLRRVRVPVVVAEILAGIVVGRSGFDLVREDPWLSMLATLGFAFLMFLSGLEIDLGALLAGPTDAGGSAEARPVKGSFWRSPLALALLSFLLTVVTALAAAVGLVRAGLASDAVLMALILSTTSLGLVVPIIKERGELDTALGQALLTAALIADFATMLAISIYVVFKTTGPTPQVLVVLLLLGAFLTVYRVLLRLHRHPPFEALFRRATEAAGHIQTRGAFAIALLFIALAERLGIEVILGAFLGGALVSLLMGRSPSPLRHQLDTLGYGFFIPIFFIMVGVRFDLAALVASREALVLLPVLLIIAYGIKLVAGLVFRLAFTWRQTIAAGLLLSSRLSLIIAASAIALDLGAISQRTNAAILLLAITTCTLSPLLYGRVLPAPAGDAKAEAAR